MCNVCDIERDSDELVMAESAKAKVNGHVYEVGVLTAGIRRDADGYYYLYSEYISDDQPAVTYNIPLNYCPECGRALKHRQKFEIDI